MDRIEIKLGAHRAITIKSRLTNLFWVVPASGWGIIIRQRLPDRRELQEDFLFYLRLLTSFLTSFPISL